MARTAPAPNIPPIPGMCPSVAVMGGGGGGSGGSGDGSGDGDGNGGPNGNGDGSNASGDGRNGGQGCGDPVCPITGRVFVDVYDFGFTAPLPLRWKRSYNSRESSRMGELGYGWSFSYGWSLEARRGETLVLDDAAKVQRFPKLEVGERASNSLGWELARDAAGYRLRVADGTTYELAPFGASLLTAGRATHRLVAIQDARRNTIQLQRDGRGALVGLIDAAGRPYRVATDSDGRLLSVSVAVDPQQSSWFTVAKYGYDTDGNLVSFVDPDGYAWSYDYAGHLLLAHNTPGGLSYRYRYDRGDHRARCIETWGDRRDGTDPALEHQPAPRPPEGQPDRRTFKGIQHIRLDYSDSERYTEVTDALGGVNRYFGDEQGRVVRIADSAGGVTTRKYDPDTGALTEETRPDGSVLRVQRAGRESTGYDDSRGQGAAVAFDGEWEFIFDRSSGGTLGRRLDRFGTPEEILHADGTQELYESDERGLLKRSVNRLGVPTRFVHDAQGNLAEAHYPAGVERFEHDYWGRRIAHVDLYGRRTEWQWDARGNVIARRSPNGSLLRIERDWFGRPTLIDDGLYRQKLAYGGIGWVTRYEAPGGRVWEYRYDPEGHLVRARSPSGREHVQSYDVAGRAVRCTTVEGIQLGAKWDAARRPTAVVDPLARQSREYGSDGALSGAETPRSKVEIRRNAASRTVAVDNGEVLVEQELDPMGQVVRDRQGVHETRIAWTGGLVSGMVSDVGVPVVRTHHPTGRVDELQGGDVRLRLHRSVLVDGTVGAWSEGRARKPVELDQLGDNLVLRRAYDAAGKLASVWVMRASLLSLEAAPVLEREDRRVIGWSEYEYDQSAKLVLERHHDGAEVRYTLDAAGQVVARRRYERGRLQRDESFAYDANGSVRMDGARYDAFGRIAELRGETFEYDAKGQLVRRMADAGPWTYEWSDTGELTRAVGPGKEIRLVYDGRGRRLRKLVLRKKEVVRDVHYVWSNNTLLHEVDATAKCSRTYLRDDDAWTPRAHVDVVGGEQRGVFYLPHPSGAVVSAIDDDGKVVFRADVGLWGDVRGAEGSVSVDVRYENQHFDEDVGLVYNFRRWYDPRTGQYLSPDPLLLDGSFNPRDFSFNPLELGDPTGLFGPGMGHPGSPARQDGQPGGHSPAPRAPSASGGHVWGTPDGTRPPRPSQSDLGDPNSNYLLGPGHYATEGSQNSVGQWVPGYAPCPPGFSPTQQSGWPADLQQQVDNAGFTHGCHSCGTTDPGPGGHFVPDHQPTVSAQHAAAAQGNPIAASSVRFYPHCRNCANNQANAQSRMARNPAANAAHGLAQAQRNASSTNPRNAGGMQSQADRDAITSHLMGSQGSYDPRPRRRGGGASPGADNNIGDNRAMPGTSYRHWR